MVAIFLHIMVPDNSGKSYFRLQGEIFLDLRWVMERAFSSTQDRVADASLR
jgi:hypothetical protein